jgi:hypothetical protein
MRCGPAHRIAKIPAYPKHGEHMTEVIPIDHAHDRPSRSAREIPAILGKLLLFNVLIVTLKLFLFLVRPIAQCRTIGLCAADATLVQAKSARET